MKLSKIALTALAATAALSLAACSSGAEKAPTGAGDKPVLKIGISQLIQHPALDAANEGFKQAFLDAGYVDGETVIFDDKNANGEQATATTIASTFASSDVDLVLAIATPAAQAAAQAITTKPVLFTAVTDAEEAGLVKTNQEPGKNVTGTSDLNPVGDQIALVTQINPEAKSIGIVYSSGEVNSKIQVDMAKEAAKTLGLEIKEATVTNTSEVAQATEALGDVDAIYVPTDNQVVAAISQVVQIAEAKGILLIGSESGQVDEGAAATYGINYVALGKQTGEMALRILTEDADPAAMPVETLSELELVVNPAAAKRMGFEIPAAMSSDADRVIK